jgi:peptidase E
VVYLPAASTAGAYVALTVAAFEGIAAVDVVGVATVCAPDGDEVDRLRSADLLDVSGGNPYVLGERLHRSGLHGVLRERVLACVPLPFRNAGLRSRAQPLASEGAHPGGSAEAERLTAAAAVASERAR